MKAKRVALVLMGVVGAGLVAIGDYSVVNVGIALAIAYAILRTGIATLAAFARPVAEPPPPGELRKVRLLYRCALCGTEVRMTVANDESPEPPRHCMEEMEEQAPAME